MTTPLHHMSPQEVREVLEQHARWLTEFEGRYVEGGTRADFSRTDLRGFDLHNVDLSWARLDGADLTDANLEHACLHQASMRECVLVRANLRSALLSYADLTWADVAHADLHDTCFEGAILTGIRRDNACFGRRAGDRVR